jgi:hypothetical protein
MNSAMPRLSVFVAIVKEIKEQPNSETKGLTFIGSFLQLFILSCLLNKIQDLKNESVDESTTTIQLFLSPCSLTQGWQAAKLFRVPIQPFLIQQEEL